ncbi:type II toxin-antitoxin system ParD family antitoxin [Granulosicoccus sp.]|nr:type II toxin-antitoxin system ParD family antitoxin [Granulosicoccus sp.]
MSMVKKSITVTDEQAEWIQAQIATGHYGSDSEVIRDALRDKQNRIAEIDYIREKLIKAEQGGFTDETPEQILAGFKESARIDGKL